MPEARTYTAGQSYEIATQEDFDACVAAGATAIVREGTFVASGSASVKAAGSASVTATGNARVVAYGCANVAAYASVSVAAYDSASVRASGSASVRASGSASVEASGSASVRAYDSASVRAYDSASVRAYDSASVRAYDSASVEAYGSASVRAYGRVIVRLLRASKIVASSSVVIVRHDPAQSVEGGTVIDRPRPATAAEWCAHYGVEVKDGIAVLYKGVAADWRSGRGTSYAPGTIPSAPDWDGGASECGGGLHFSPHPRLTHLFVRRPARYVACPVAVADMRSPRPDDEYPTKIKARGCAGPVWEVDRDGNRVASMDSA